MKAGEEVKFPLMRANLVSAIEFLANSTVEWKHVRYDEAGTLVSFIDFDLAIHILFDDIDNLCSDPRAQIGYTLANEAEADAVQRLCRTLEIVLDMDDPDDLGESYVRTPRWLDVAKLAAEALLIMTGAGKTV
ncbi:SCO4402 family protein [Rhizobium sp.]